MNLNINARMRNLLDHVWGPTGSIILHVLVIIALLKLVMTPSSEKAPEVEVVIMEPDAMDLEEFQKELEKLDDMPEVVEAVTPPE